MPGGQRNIGQWQPCMMRASSRDVVACRRRACPIKLAVTRAQVIGGYPNAEVVWCQEEPKNMGAWSYVKPRLETALRPQHSNDGVQVRMLLLFRGLRK